MFSRASSANGGGVLPMTASLDLRTTRAPTRSRSTVRRPTDAFWRFWISRHRKAMPDGRVRCSAQALGDVDVQYVWRFLREHDIDLAARKSWCESNDPEFAAKAADVVGLYIDPPAKAIVTVSMKNLRSRRWNGHKGI